MRNIALISGAYKNAGDFLIEDRCSKLLAHLLEEVKIHRVVLNEVKDSLENINSMDAIVFHGGPIFSNSLEKLFQNKINPAEIVPRIIVVGGGWYGKCDCNSLPYRYKFTDYTLNFWKHVDNTGYGLGCRDLFTVNTLKGKGLGNVVMTGCSAWYDLPSIKSSKLRNNFSEIKRIFVSEPANKENFILLFEMITYLKSSFGGAEINIVVHRDKEVFLKRNKAEWISWYEKNGIGIFDITNGHGGFAVYNDSDLHIGFRVHAHIYNLSIRNRSILIEEDGRGAGVNQALGLVSIKAYDDRFAYSNDVMAKITKKLGYIRNYKFINEIDSYLSILSDTDDIYMHNAFLIMQKYYANMKRHILKLNMY